MSDPPSRIFAGIFALAVTWLLLHYLPTTTIRVSKRCEEVLSRSFMKDSTEGLCQYISKGKPWRNYYPLSNE